MAKNKQDWFIGRWKKGKIEIFISQSLNENFKIHLCVNTIFSRNHILLGEFKTEEEAKKEFDKIIKLQEGLTYPYV